MTKSTVPRTPISKETAKIENLRPENPFFKKYLAKKNAKIVGLVGAGAQARTQLMSLLSVYKELEEVRVWSRTEKTRRTYVTEMKSRYSNVAKMI